MVFLLNSSAASLKIFALSRFPFASIILASLYFWVSATVAMALSIDWGSMILYVSMRSTLIP